HQPATPMPQPGVPPVPRWLRLLLPLAVAGITLLVFLPALRNGFVNWDDDKNLLDNDHFRGLGWPQIRWMLTTYWVGHYHPLTWLSLAIDYRIWGLGERGAFGFHLTNMVVHALNALLFYFVARRLLALAVPARAQSGAALHFVAAFSALLFSVHPLRVESVAWVTERRDVLSVAFMLPCLLAYVRYASGAPRRWFWYTASVGLLLLSLLCKAWGMTLPAVLLLLDWYPLRRTRDSARAWSLLLEKLPFVALAGWAAYHALCAQGSAQYTLKSVADYGWLCRAAQAFYGVAFYIWKTVLPTGLAAIYEIPLRMNPFELRFIAAAVLVMAISALAVVGRRRWPAVSALWICYLIVVSPVLGLTQAGPQLVADRYSYVSCLTWALLAGAGLLRMVSRNASPRPAHLRVGVSASLALGVLAILGTLTWRQTKVWRSSETLWTHALTVSSDSYNAHTNLAVDLQRQGKYGVAERYYRKAMALNPGGFEALGNLAGLLIERGRDDEALPCLRQALERNPAQTSLLTNMAILLHRQGRYEEAVTGYRERLAANPPANQQAKLYAGLGGALGSLRRLPEAVECLRQAIALAPDNEVAHFNLALALRQMGDAHGALVALETALRLDEELLRVNPDMLPRTHFLDALVSAAELYAAQGDQPHARACLQRAMQLDPNDVRIPQRLRQLQDQR
ncbi:MAG: tetratricopeptide repeat protein, partial [Armatimonadetes bacterium]|nr:tetratricopeptide repeat protein [Armatimonadota bacterium]